MHCVGSICGSILRCAMWNGALEGVLAVGCRWRKNRSISFRIGGKTVSEEIMNGLSRRSFLKGASLAAVAGAGAAALAGCSSSSESASSESSAAASSDVVPSRIASSAATDIWALDEVGEPTETIDADVCIIGGGGTGMAAALQATELGMSVVLLEKAGELGGAFSATEGMFGVGTHWQEEAGEYGTVAEAVDRCVEYNHYVPNIRLYKNFFSQTAETIDWLEERGCNFRAVVDLGGNLAWHVYYYDENASSPGAYFVDSLVTAVEATDTQMLMSTTAKKIIMEDGAAAGVIAEGDDGTVTQINAPVVMLASGGYSSNQDFLHAVSVYTVNENITSLGAPGRDGDGLRMGVDAGVALSEGYGTVMWCGPCTIGASWATDAYSASVQPTLWVNQKGERYIAEDLWIANFSAGGVAARNQKRTYVIFTENDLLSWEENGPYGTVFTFGTPGVPMSDAREQLTALDACHVADTIAELAEAVGIDADALQETVDTYNGYCAAGVDEDYGKAAEYLTPVEEGPFYILEVADAYYTTVGGLEISENAEALDNDQNVIPGLYVGGCDAGSLYGDSYDVATAPGSQASWAINSGRLAMKHAATYLGL